LSIKNFYAEVSIEESETLILTANEKEFQSLRDLSEKSEKEGYSGGLRLLQVIKCGIFHHLMALIKGNLQAFLQVLREERACFE